MLDQRLGSKLQAAEKRSTFLGERSWLALLSLACVIILFHRLGGAALFDPDEGRNAEKAREILLLADWVTPHQNFLPTLDKPILFYWLVALSFKVFGFAEWSARLPSVLSAMGCLFLVYRFARAQWGFWEALWSCLILATSVQFFVLSRIVIFDMTLTLFITWALFSFYKAQQSDESASSYLQWLPMYVAMGAGTLVKGPVAVIVPGMVIFFYLLFSRKWFLLRRMKFVSGIMVFLAVAAPWYVWAELRNPGYLRYFLWEEHFVRYLTPQFSRTKSWYYFFVVVGTGFLPWSLMVPLALRSLWRRLKEETHLFLLSWVALPFIFFSASNSKLPHYVLPIFPALALLMGRALGSEAFDSTNKRGRRFFVILIFPAAFAVYLVTGEVWPNLLPDQIRAAVIDNSSVIALYAVILLLIFAVSGFGQLKELWQDRGAPFLCTAVSLALFFALVAEIIAATSFHRASKALAQELATVIGPGDRLVFYNTYFQGVPFYLRVDKPVWLVQAADKTDVGNYVVAHRPAPAPGYGPVLFTFAEFAERWKNEEMPLRVVMRERHLARFRAELGAMPKKLIKLNEHVLISNR